MRLLGVSLIGEPMGVCEKMPEKFLPRRYTRDAALDASDHEYLNKTK
jgi:hypothetical protein